MHRLAHRRALVVVALASAAPLPACVAADIFPERGGVWIDEMETTNLAVDSEVRIEGVPYIRASTCIDRCSENPTRARLQSVVCDTSTCTATPVNVDLEAERVWFTLSSTAPGITTVTVDVVGSEGQQWRTSHPMQFWDPTRLELVGAMGRTQEMVILAGTAFSARVNAFAQSSAGELRLRTGQGVAHLEATGAVDAAGSVAHAARPGRGEVAYRLGTARIVRPVRVVAPEDVARVEVHAATWATIPVVGETALTALEVGTTSSTAFAIWVPLKDGTLLTAVDAKPEVVPADLGSIATVRDEPLYFGISPRRTGTGVLRLRVGTALAELPLTITQGVSPSP